MTGSMLIDRFERFRQSVELYREMCQRDVPHSHSRTEFVDVSGLEDIRDKLRKQLNHLQEYVTAFSHGRFQIHVDSRGLQDIYEQAFSENCRQWHLDTILEDLAEMIRKLQARPLHEPVMLPVLKKSARYMKPYPSIGSLGHLGSAPGSPNHASLQTGLSSVAQVLQQRNDRSEDQETLLRHLQAIMDHPEITPLLLSSRT